LLLYILFEKYIHIFAEEMAGPEDQHYRHTFIPYFLNKQRAAFATGNKHDV